MEIGFFFMLLFCGAIVIIDGNGWDWKWMGAFFPFQVCGLIFNYQGIETFNTSRELKSFQGRKLNGKHKNGAPRQQHQVKHLSSHYFTLHDITSINILLSLFSSLLTSLQLFS